jgi:Tol biopolymer transport system component
MSFKRVLSILILLWSGVALTSPTRADETSSLLFVTQQLSRLQRDRGFGIIETYFTHRIQFFTLQPETGKRQRLAEITFNECRAGLCEFLGFRWLPERNQVVYYAQVEGYLGLYLLDLNEGAVPEKIVDGGLIGLAVSSDERWLVYSQSTNPEALSIPARLYRIALDGEKTPLVLLPELDAWQVVLSVDPLGEYITFNSATYDPSQPFESAITTYHLNLANLALVEVQRSSQVDSAVWSPDGHQIAFCERRQLFIADRGGQTRKQITPSTIPCLGLAWLPQGDRLLYSDGRNLFTVRVVDGVIQKVFGSGTPVSQVSISPDGQQLAFIRNNWLEVVPLDGSGSVRRLTGEHDYVVGIAW